MWSCLPSSVSLGDKQSLSLGELIRPFCITILYHKLLLFIDIFHIWRRYLCYFIYFACFMIIWGSRTGARILLEKAPSECNISEDQQLKEIIRKFLFFQMTKGSRRGAEEGCHGPPQAGAGPALAAPPCGEGAHSPLWPPLLRVFLHPENLSSKK